LISIRLACAGSNPADCEICSRARAVKGID
jgi:hypothetical protein